MTGEGPDMKEYLEEKKAVFGPNTIEGLKEQLDKAELRAKYYQGQYELLIKRHKHAFDYMSKLYAKVLGRLREAQARERGR